MTHTYTVEGMTCQSCVAHVKSALSAVDHVESVDVDLASKKATIKMDRHIGLDTLKDVLLDRYTIKELDTHMPTSGFEEMATSSKLQQLKPLFIILGYITVASFLLHHDNINMWDVMLDFMGLFFIVFSFFKMLDINGFANSFMMYDPLANRLPAYAKVYPFIETILGMMFLFRFELKFALVLTVIILGATTFGVTRTLLSKRQIKCACLGTALDLPMTEATFIENALMIVMSLVMLFSMFF